MWSIQETGVFHFQILVAVGYALSISQPDKHHCLPCRGQSFGTTGEFSYQHAEQHTRETQTNVCLERETRQGCSRWLASKPTIQAGSSDRPLAPCVFIWYHLSVGGTASDRSPWILSTRYETHLYTCRPVHLLNKIFSLFFYYQSFQACSTHSFQEALLKPQMSYLPLSCRTWGGKLLLKGQIGNIPGFENQEVKLRIWCRCSGKESPTNAGDARDIGSVPKSGTSLGGGNGDPLQDSCLYNSMDGGAQWATVHGVQRVGHNWPQQSNNFYNYLKMWAPFLAQEQYNPSHRPAWTYQLSLTTSF